MSRFAPAVLTLVFALAGCGERPPTAQEVSAVLANHPQLVGGLWAEIPKERSAWNGEFEEYVYPALKEALRNKWVDCTPFREDVPGHCRISLNEAGKKVFAGWKEEEKNYVVPIAWSSFERVSFIAPPAPTGEFQVRYFYRTLWIVPWPRQQRLAMPTEGTAVIAKQNGKWVVLSAGLGEGHLIGRKSPRQYDESSPYSF